MSLSRRRFVQIGVGGTLSMAVASQASAAAVQWHNPQEWGVEGRGWSDTDRYYDRLPSRAKGNVPDSVWGLSHHTAGICVRFKTDSPTISIPATIAWPDSTTADKEPPTSTPVAIDKVATDISDARADASEGPAACAMPALDATSDAQASARAPRCHGRVAP